MRTREKVSTPAAKNIKELLLSGPRFEIIVLKRTKWRRRPPVIFD
jgi:hypothetical protein